VQPVFITRQSDPEIKNIAHKNHIAGAAFQGGQHVEKGLDVPLASADVRIRDHHQGLSMVVRGNFGARRLAIHPINPTTVAFDDGFVKNPMALRESFVTKAYREYAAFRAIRKLYLERFTRPSEV